MHDASKFDKLTLYHNIKKYVGFSAMDTRQLTIFVEAARTRNFRAAAAQLGIAQPAVTQRIRQLEESLGFPLFRRINRGVELTPAGQAMLVEAEEILARTKVAQEKADQIRRGEFGIVRIGFGTSVMADQKLPALIAKFIGANVSTRLELVPGTTMDQLIKDVATRQTDVAFVRAPLPQLPQTLRAVAFDGSRLCVALSERHELASRRTLSIEEICQEKLLLPVDETGVGLSHSALSLFIDRGLEPDIGMRIANVNTILALVEAGAGIAILPEKTVRATRGVTGVPFTNLDTVSESVILVRRGVPGKHLQSFLNMARDM
ncbi:LysR family transcriptional regulator [Agrobacterium sp. NPDC090273]|uniref:LysR family transcriptional regulator n=1 Tax=Agrobacterium sp. NPDC090273 TaxID=3363919 RepID=UPI00383BB6B7